MFSIFLLMLAAAGTWLAAGGLLAWRHSRSNLVLFSLAALAAVVIETLVAGAGRWLGAGDRLRDLYAFPILIAAFAWPLTLFTLATLSRRLGFAWARIDWGHGAVCLLAVALLVYNLRNLFSLRQLDPACWRDVVWYLRSVPQGMACPGDVPLHQGPWPADLVVVLLAWLGLGAGLWRRRGWPWLFAALLGGAGLLLLPAQWGPVPWYLGLNLVFAAIALETLRHAGVLARPPEGPG